MKLLLISSQERGLWGRLNAEKLIIASNVEFLQDKASTEKSK